MGLGTHGTLMAQPKPANRPLELTVEVPGKPKRCYRCDSSLRNE